MNKGLRSLIDRVGIEYLSRMGVQIASFTAIFLILVQTNNLWESHRLLVVLLSIFVILGISATPFIREDNMRRRRLTLLFTIIAWSILMAFTLPFYSPFMIVNILLMFLVIEHNSKFFVNYSALLLLVAIEISVIIATSQPSDKLWIPLTTGLAVILMAVFGSGVIGLKDLSERKRLQEMNDAKIERERLHSLINSMRDSVITTDDNSNIIEYNAATLDLLDSNLSLDNKKLQNVMSIVDAENKPVDIVEKAREQKDYLISRDYKLRLGKEDKTSLYVSVAPVHVGYGKSGRNGYVIVLRDITHEKSLEEERDEFISVVSHELRTPVTITEASVSNAILMVDKNVESEKIKANLNEAHDQVVFLASMINDLSTLSRAEKEKLSVDLETIKPIEVVNELKESYTGQAEEKGLKLETDVPLDTPTIISSKLYLKEILQNFITNSIKYTKEGSVTIRLKVNGNNTVTFSIVDTGIGVSKSDKKKLFDKFFRSEDYRTRESSGTGLGLYITKKLAQRIDAKITVESELNKGSEFNLTMPHITKKDVNKKQTAEVETKKFIGEL